MDWESFFWGFFTCLLFLNIIRMTVVAVEKRLEESKKEV